MRIITVAVLLPKFTADQEIKEKFQEARIIFFFFSTLECTCGYQNVL